MPQYATANTLLSRAAIELGLISTPLVNAYSNSDANIIQLRYLLNTIGERLVRKYQWSHLKQLGQVVPVVDQTTYNLPSDFHRLVNQTGWDRTAREPFAGPLTSQNWQAWIGSGITSLIRPVFRIWQGQFEFMQAPTAQLTFEYISRNWVVSDGSSERDDFEATDKDDTPQFDTPLLVAALKMEFRKAKRLEYSAEAQDFQDALDLALGADGGAPVLSLTGSDFSPRLIDAWNAPDTGYGS